MRAITSFPPPAAKPTMIWIARVGYLAGSSCASAVFVARRSAQRPMRSDIAIPSKPRDMDMRHAGLPVVERGKSTVDGVRQFIRFAHTRAVSAECLGDLGEIAPLALAARHQPRLELIGLGGNPLGIDALGRRFHRLPATIVDHDRENR